MQSLCYKRIKESEQLKQLVALHIQVTRLFEAETAREFTFTSAILSAAMVSGHCRLGRW